MSVIDNLKYQFKAGGMYLRLLYINVAIFLVIGILHVFSSLMNVTDISNNIVYYFGLNTNLEHLFLRPYSLVTYMFIHKDFWHLLSNMLMLLFIGKLLESYLGPKKILSIYVVGAIVGGILQVLAKNVFPVFQTVGDYPIIGASAGVMALATALITYAPQLEMMLFGAVRMKIIWIIGLFLIADFFQMHNVNSGVAHFAHLGGALFGFLFVVNYRKGKDWLKWFDKLMAFFTNFNPKTLFKVTKKSKMKVSYSKYRDEGVKPPRDDKDFNAVKKERQEKLDAILDKIKYKGYEGLSASEKEFLANFK
jgi:membrane associated rhomboid family serine protease